MPLVWRKWHPTDGLLDTPLWLSQTTFELPIVQWRPMEPPKRSTPCCGHRTLMVFGRPRSHPLLFPTLRTPSQHYAP